MYVGYQGSIRSLIAWQWKSVLTFSVASTVVVLLERWLATYGYQISLPLGGVAVVGATIGIFVSFRTNAAYGRWWEGRQLWGRLVNSSRHFTTQVLTYLPAPEQGVEEQPPVPSELQRSMVRRHIAYVHALRVVLRGGSLAIDREFLEFLPEIEAARVAAESNPTHALLHTQMRLVAGENEAGRLDAWRLQSFDGTIRALLDIQGGCERIKNTPFPRSYGFIADRLIIAYGCLLPLAIVDTIEQGWAAILLTVFVCLSFALISEVGRILEDPFENVGSALPLSAISKTIEINLRQRLGDTDLPPLPQQNAKGILM
jgi:putative membrane protein